MRMKLLNFINNRDSKSILVIQLNSILFIKSLNLRTDIAAPICNYLRFNVILNFASTLRVHQNYSLHEKLHTTHQYIISIPSSVQNNTHFATKTMTCDSFLHILFFQ